MFPHVDADHWRDYTAMNEWVVRSSNPSIAAEYSHDWVDRAQMGRMVFAARSESAAMIDRIQLPPHSAYGVRTVRIAGKCQLVEHHQEQCH
jgi:hypothetical protein